MSGVVLGLCVVLMISVSCTGQTLECFHCELGFWDMCHITKVNCSAGEQCFVGIGVAASVLKIKMMGCLAIDDCNKTTIVTFPANKTLYKMTKSLKVCCGIWHQYVNSRSFKCCKLRGGASMDQTCFVQYIPHMLNCIEIWRIWRPSQHFKLIVVLIKTICEPFLLYGMLHYPAERGHSHQGLPFL
ncbi:hypothetical protein QTP70_016634 [Hemibagrus guttatus]|uniref:Uncharacterized protein n=1 Tax=Hemibagrus guttatus TaxID=175788 RepID=A0AAE0RD39_9TELE|nr:hypothetical protein QTP70_016634 [Hemibagrus guttatus]